MFKKIKNGIRRFRLGIHRARFNTLKKRYVEAGDIFKRKKIKSNIENLLIKVQKLGELGKPLEQDIQGFLENIYAVLISSTPMYELIKKNIEDRENKPVITIQPNHLRDLPKVKVDYSLAALFREREGKTIRVQSTLKEREKNQLESTLTRIDKHSRKIKHERFKAD